MSGPVRTRAASAALAVVAVIAVASGCGASRPMTNSAAQALQQQVQSVRTAVAAGSHPQIDAAVQRLRDLVTSETDQGNLSKGRAEEILAALDGLVADLGSRPSPSPSAVAPSHTESPTPSPTPAQTSSPTPSPSSTRSPTPSPTPSESSLLPTLGPTDGAGSPGTSGPPSPTPTT